MVKKGHTWMGLWTNVLIARSTMGYNPKE